MMGGIDCTGAALVAVSYTEANEITHARDAVAPGEIATLEEKARTMTHEETVASLAAPFDDPCGSFRRSHWREYRPWDSATLRRGRRYVSQTAAVHKEDDQDMSIGEGNEFGCPWWSVVARVNYGSAREAMGAGFLVFGLCSLWGWWLLWRGVT